MKKAYLYSRVSKEVQSIDGEGLRRQEELGLKFLSNHPDYELETSISDAASAYYGRNLEDSSGLGSFINMCKSGAIERGSLLIIEAPDRLSRLGIREGQRVIDELFSYGIDIGLVRFGLIIKHDDVNDFTGSLIVTVGLYLGRLESEQKSQRIKSTFKIRREESRTGKKRTSVCPFWLVLSDDRERYLLNEPYYSHLQRMIKLKLEGNGVDTIRTILQEEGATSPKGTSYSRSGIRKALTSISLKGHFQPMVTNIIKGKRVDTPDGELIEDYYPVVMEPTAYDALQLTFKKHNIKGKSKDTFQNLFRGILRCHSCHSTVSYHHGSTRKSIPKIRCNGRYQTLNGCTHPNTNYPPLESALTRLLSFLDLSMLGNDNAPDTVSLEARIATLEESVSNYTEAIATATSVTLPVLLPKLEEVTVSLVNCREELLSIQRDNVTVEIPNVDLTDGKDRVRYNLVLRSVIDYISMEDNDTVEIKFKTAKYPLVFELSHVEDSEQWYRSLLEEFYQDLWQ